MKPSEQRLLALFSGTMLLAGSWMAWSNVSEARGAMREEAAALQGQTDLDRIYVTEFAGELEAADAWMRERVGEPISSQQAMSELLDSAQDSASAAGLRLRDPNFRSPEERGRYLLARVVARVDGAEQAVYSWLASFHDPDRLRSVHALTIQPNRDDDTVISAEVEFARWFLSSDDPEDIIE